MGITNNKNNKKKNYNKKIWLRFGNRWSYSKFGKQKILLKWVIKHLKYKKRFDSRTGFSSKKNSWYYLRRKTFRKWKKKKKFFKLTYNSKNIILKKNSIIKLYVFNHFFNSLHVQWALKDYKEIRYFLKVFVGIFIKNGNKEKIKTIIFKVLKFLCYKYKISIWSLLFFLYSKLKPSVYLKNYYFYRKSFYMSELVRSPKRSATVIGDWIRKGLLKRKERTLFLRLLNELNDLFITNPLIWKAPSKSFILLEKKIYNDKIRETLIRDRYPYKSLINTGFTKKKKISVL